jgi:hypothetical protein
MSGHSAREKRCARKYNPSAQAHKKHRNSEVASDVIVKGHGDRQANDKKDGIRKYWKNGG